MGLFLTRFVPARLRFREGIGFLSGGTCMRSEGSGPLWSAPLLGLSAARWFSH